MKDKILIIGGYGRIGSSLSKHLINNNKNLIIADIKKKKSELDKYHFENFDITDIKNINKNLNYIFNKYKDIKSVVNCSYPTRKGWGKKFEDINLENLQNAFKDQLFSNIFLCKFLLNHSKKFKVNAIFLSSIQGIALPKFHHYQNLEMYSPLEYTLIKSSLLRLIKYVVKYSKNKNLRLNCISPGGILDNQNKIFTQRYKKDCISKGLLEPNDLLSAFDFLLSKKSAFINGQNIIIDDGWSL